ncbi:protein BASIC PENTACYSTEINE2-like [Lycium ferocissimum]|uniref:protein BASIC PENTACYSTEINE2-like n=1 Tax=Lycium ferocissimum TaxID=112874 RepID=UPI0028157822|nr:protein BASIC PENTACYSTEINE2-like [Lycium ferocissimum]XP_059300079.1 protein BASIC PENTACYSTEINE2-like [Lycium ferocissimum]XP_059300081.1 protein BASIC PENTACYSTEINE2-like [Lycium ferocissimum]
MDGNGGMNIRNWGFFEPTTTVLKGHLGLQLMSSVDEKPHFGNICENHQLHHHQQQTHQPDHPTVMALTNGGAFHHHRVCGLSEYPMPMDYMREMWVNHKDYREKYFNLLSANHHYLTGYGYLPETSSTQSMQMHQQPNLVKVEAAPLVEEEVCQEMDIGGLAKKRGPGKSELLKPPKTKKAKKATRTPKGESTPSVPRARAPRKSAEVVINGINMDISGIPIPICSCTGAAQQCYRWGCGGWQSACCTTNLSSYPLPMNVKRRGSRIAGRKMSLGAFKKVLEKLASEGYNFSNPIDLKPHWAKHGTNKFVTIR